MFEKVTVAGNDNFFDGTVQHGEYDLKITKKMKGSGILIDKSLLDHLIINPVRLN